MRAPPPLRRYQQEAYAAILRAIDEHRAGVVTLQMSRQSGKNEVSTRVEATLMAAAHAGRYAPVGGIKAAPTQTPQAVRSLRRLHAHLAACGYKHHDGLRRGDDTVDLGPLAAWAFLSGEPTANVVGGTASTALEIDEAQDFDTEIHDRVFRPMASSTAAATIYYGTAWTNFDLLATTRAAALELEQRDSIRRVFDVPWDRVAEEVPAYGLFVESEKARLGHTPEKPHPVFLTQYELRPQAGAGLLFNPAQLAALQGDQPALAAPPAAGGHFVAGLDVGGANLSGADDPDETVLTIGEVRRVRTPAGSDPRPDLRIVQQYSWQGLDHEKVWPDIVALLAQWNARRVVVDASGIGEPLATHLVARFGGRRVEPFKFTRPSKSALGYDLLAAVNRNQLKLARPGDEWPHAPLLAQLRAARRELKPGGYIDFYCVASESHDDRVASLALTVRAAGTSPDRSARQQG